MKILTKVILLAFVAISAMQVFAQQQVPAPTNFTVSLTSSSGEKYYVQFAWKYASSNIAATKFVIYYASGNTEDKTKFKQLTYASYKSGVEDYTLDYKLPAGEYTFFITTLAYIKDQNGKETKIESEASSFAHLTVQSGPYIKIVSSPPNEGKIKLNSDWVYDLKIQTNITTQIKYAFEGTVPDGMTIDENTGKITWKPAQNGKYTVIVKAYSVNDPTVYTTQKLVLVVGDGDVNPKPKCAWIYGVVKDENGNPVTEGWVRAWFVTSNNKEAGKYIGSINKDGTFLINLPDGNYYLQVSGNTFIAEYYNNTTDLTTATKVEIKCGDSLKYDFTVTPKAAEKKFTVTGKVVSANDNTPVPSIVEFIVVGYKDKNSGEKKGVYSTKTQTDGTYSIVLSDAFEYIAQARPVEKNSQYYNQYYNNVSTSVEATKLTLTGNLSDINFALKSTLSSEKGKLSGQTVDSNGNGIKSQVIAYLINSQTNKEKSFIFKVSVMTDDNGYFSFDNLIYGDYVIQSVPLEKPYIPGYYKVNDFVINKWKEATIVTINKADNGSVVIKHPSKAKEKGIVVIKGKVIKEKGLSGKSFDTPLETESVIGSVVYITDESGEIVDYAITDINGDYLTNEVSVGTSTVLADKVGYDPAVSQITLDYLNNPVGNVDLTLTTEDLEVREEPAVNSRFTISPNPATDYLTIHSEAGINKIEIFSVLGEKVLEQLYSGRIYIGDLQPGFYFIKTGNILVKFIKQ